MLSAHPRQACTIIILVLQVFLASCTPPLAGPIGESGGHEPTRGGTLELALLGDVRTLDPAQITSGVEGSIAANLYAGLVDVTPEGAVVPVLADRVDVVETPPAVRVTLRPGLRFHDGAEVDAASVVRSFERLVARGAPSVQATFLDVVRGVDAFRSGAATAIDGLVVEGPRTLRIDLRHFDAAFLPSLTLIAARPVCPSAAPSGSPSFVACGAGPFRLPAGGFVRGESVAVERFDGWFRPDLPRLERVRWRLQASPREQDILFSRGRLHVARDLPSHVLARYLDDPRWANLHEREAATTFWGEALNTERFPFDNVEVRRAVASAIDRNHIVAIDPLRIRVGTGPLPPGAAGFDPSLRCQKFDRAAALEHMRRAGFPYDPATRQGGVEAPISYLATARTFAERGAQVLQAQLAAIGLRLAPRLVSYPAYIATTRRRGAVPMASTGWTQDFPDPSNFFDALYTKASISTDDSTNTSAYSNDALEALLASAHREFRPTERTAIFARASRLICDEAPIAFTHVPEAVVLRQGFVRELVLHPVWLYALERTWLSHVPVLPTSHPVEGVR